MDIELISFGILAPISLLSQLILIYGYIRIKDLRQHPDMLTFWHCVSESIVDLSWITGIAQVHKYLSGPTCQFIGAFFMYFYFLHWDYMLFLSLEILIKVKDPLNCKHNQRVKFYHIISNLLSLGIYIWLSVAKDNNGKSGLKTCFVEQESIYELLILVPSLIHLPVMIGICLYILWASRKLRHSSYAKHHIYVVTTFVITRIPVCLADGLNYEKFNIDNMKELNYVGDM